MSVLKRLKICLGGRFGPLVGPCLIFGLSWVSPATARAGGVTLEWTAPPACPTQERVELDVDAMLSADVKSGATLHAKGVIEAAEDGWVLHLRLDAESGTLERKLEDSSCQVLGEVAALYIALAIDPNAAISSRPAAETPEPVPVEVEEPLAELPEETLREPVEDVPESAPAPAGVRTRFIVGVGAAGTLGLLPRPAVNLALLYGLERGWLGFEVAVFTDLPRSYHYEDPAEAGANFSLSGAAIGFCPALHPSSFRLAVCASVEAGGLTAKGVGVTRTSTYRSFWFATDLGARLSWTPKAPFRVFLRGDLVLPSLRAAIGVGGLPPLFRVPAVGGRLGLGIAFELQADR